MGDYAKLKVWQASHRLTLEVYHATSGFPADERFGIVSQLRRAAASIPANIAEGCGRDTDGELARSLRIALGSASECEYHLLLAHDLGFLAPVSHQTLRGEIIQIKRMLGAFVERVRPRGTVSRPTADS